MVQVLLEGYRKIVFLFFSIFFYANSAALIAAFASFAAGFAKGGGAFYKELVCQDSAGGKHIQDDAGGGKDAWQAEYKLAGIIEVVNYNPCLERQGNYGGKYGCPHLENPEAESGECQDIQKEYDNEHD